MGLLIQNLNTRKLANTLGKIQIKYLNPKNLTEDYIMYNHVKTSTKNKVYITTFVDRIFNVLGMPLAAVTALSNIDFSTTKSQKLCFKVIK